MEFVPHQTLIRRASSLMLALGLLLAFGGEVFAEGESVYRTGLEAKRAWFAVSPDGRQLVIDTDQINHGLQMLDLRSGKFTAIPEDEGRSFSFPAWSSDGKWLAAVSLERANDLVSVEGMKIVLIDVGTWKTKVYAVGEGIIGYPFFSADGKTVYYGKGHRRSSGKTVASNYDIYAIDLASGRETQLTFEKYYQMDRGDDIADSILFGTTNRGKDAFGHTVRGALFRYDKVTRLVSLVNIDQSSGIFEFNGPMRDSQGNLYFIAAKNRPGGGNYLWFLVRANPDGRQIEVLSELQYSMSFDIAKNTGEIFIMDRLGNELIIRRLSAKAAY